MADNAQVDSPPAPGDAEASVEAEEAPDVQPPEPEPSVQAGPPEEVPEEGWQTVKPKRRGRPPGSKNKVKIVALPAEPKSVEPEAAEEEEPEEAAPPLRAATRRRAAPVSEQRRSAPQQQPQQPMYFAPPTFWA